MCSLRLPVSTKIVAWQKELESGEKSVEPGKKSVEPGIKTKISRTWRDIYGGV